MPRAPKEGAAGVPQPQNEPQADAAAEGAVAEATAGTTEAPTSTDEAGPGAEPAGEPAKPETATKAARKTAAKATAAAKPAAPKEPEAKASSDWDLGVPLTGDTELINACYYGPEGTGKTTDVMYMANLGQVLVINAEAGIKKRRLAKLGVNVDNIRVWPDVERGERLTFDGLEQVYWRMASMIADRPGIWVGTIWDSLTEIHKLLLDRQVEAAFQKASDSNKPRERFFIDRSDYGVMAEQVRLLLRRFRDLPVHYAITALERRDQDDDGKVIYSPAVTPALITDVPGFFDILVHTEIMEIAGEDEYIGLTRRQGKYRAKDRWGVLPKHMVNPNFERIHAYVHEQLDLESDPIQAEVREKMAALAKAGAAAETAA